MGTKIAGGVPLTREKILRAAVRLADRQGLEKLSMRALGRQLGREAMSLYNHVADKDDLLDGIVDLVSAEIALPGGGTDWREAMRVRARSAREVFARHPWAPRLIDTRISSGPARLRYLDAVLGTLRRAGFGVGLAIRAFSVLDSYLYGFGRKRTDVPADSGSPQAAEAFLREFPAGEYPHLAEMATAFATGPGYDEDADFAFGLELILDGLQRVLDESRRPRGTKR